MKTHKMSVIARVSMLVIFGLGLAGSAQAAGTVWVSNSFGQSGDKVGQFADHGDGVWVQVMKDGTHVRSYRETSVNDPFVQRNGDGGAIRLYADHAKMQKDGNWNRWTVGSFRAPPRK